MGKFTQKWFDRKWVKLGPQSLKAFYAEGFTAWMVAETT
jgi:hypothetical protein